MWKKWAYIEFDLHKKEGDRGEQRDQEGDLWGQERGEAGIHQGAQNSCTPRSRRPGSDNTAEERNNNEE